MLPEGTVQAVGCWAACRAKSRLPVSGPQGHHHSAVPLAATMPHRATHGQADETNTPLDDEAASKCKMAKRYLAVSVNGRQGIDISFRDRVMC